VLRSVRLAVCLTVLASLTVGTAIRAQDAQPQPPEPSTPLPAVTVETTQAPTPAPKKKKKSAAAKAAPQQAASTPAPQTSSSAGGSGPETALGPVDGLVATRSATGTKTDTPIVEVPQVVNVVPADQITSQGAQTVAESLRYVPGVVSDPQGVGALSSTYIRSRGFLANLYLDGMRLPQNGASAAFPEIEVYNLERIEVLKGPSSGLYGSSGPGGLVNMVSKRPTFDTPIREVAVQTGSFNRKQAMFDIGDKFVGTDDVAFRVVGLIRDSDTQLDFQEDNREFIAPSLSVKLSQDTTLTMLSSYLHEDENFNFFNSLPASGTVLPNPNGRISQSFYFGNPEYDNFEREQFSLGYAFEHHFNSALTFRQNLRYMEVDYDHYATAPQRAVAGNAASNNPRTGLANTDPTQRISRMGSIYLASESEQITIDNQLEGRFDTGPLRHTAIVGFDYRQTDSSYYFLGGGNATSIDVFNPTYFTTAILPPTTVLQNDVYDTEQKGVYAQDQIKLDGFILTLGGRYDWASTLTDELGTTAVGFLGSDGDEAFTGRVALGYLFDSGLAPYVTYATSFDPVTGINRVGAPFRPTTGEQYEAGIKYQPPGTKTLLSAAVFDLTQQNVLTPDPLATGRSIQTGEVNVKGFEVEGKAEVTSNLTVLAAYSYLDGEITKSNVAGERGQRPQLTPPHQASIWGEYAFDGSLLDGITVGAGVRYMGETALFLPAVNAAIPPFVLETPAYTLMDAMVSFDLGTYAREMEGTQLRINVTNLTDEYYIASCSQIIQCFMGQGRTVLGTLSYNW
jgi:iron complex outermembrane recepter protein